MRSSVGFNTPPMTSSSSSSSLSSPPFASIHHQLLPSHSAWHSPVPYLFGGLAAMLGLIAFALLILACSYWKLSGYLDASEEGSGDLEAGGSAEGAKAAAAEGKPQAIYEQRLVVIMAGDEKPTFLAIPILSRASSSLGDQSSSAGESRIGDGGDGDLEGKKVDSGDEGESLSSQENDQNTQLGQEQ